MLSKNKRAVGIVGEFLEMDPPRLLSHAFRLTALDDAPLKITYMLAEPREGTEFHLIAENIVAGSKSEKSMDDGARIIVANLKAFVETGPVPLGPTLINALFGLMGAFVPPALKAKNWPHARPY
jgi:hypothetical protein